MILLYQGSVSRYQFLVKVQKCTDRDNGTPDYFTFKLIRIQRIINCDNNGRLINDHFSFSGYWHDSCEEVGYTKKMP